LTLLKKFRGNCKQCWTWSKRTCRKYSSSKNWD